MFKAFMLMFWDCLEISRPMVLKFFEGFSIIMINPHLPACLFNDEITATWHKQEFYDTKMLFSEFSIIWRQCYIFKKKGISWRNFEETP